MKYVYSTLAIAGLVGGLLTLAWRGFGVEAMLVFIFGAICSAASEITELGEKIKAR